MSQYTCALSGIRAKEEEIIDGEYPDGWIEITLNRRYVNAKYEAIQYVKAGVLQQYLMSLPEDQREQQAMAMSIQVEAQYAQLEAQTEKWSEDEITLYIANPDENPALFAEYNKLRKMLGLNPDVRLDEELPTDHNVVTEKSEPEPVEQTLSEQTEAE